jgi:gluconolactonase
METTRRRVLAGGAAVAATLAHSRAFGGWEPSERYPDPAITALDPSFLKYRVFNASIERLATGMRWSEGPVWFGDARCVLWSDIPNNRMMRWDETTA